MAKLSATNKETIPEFQKFLMDRNLAPARNIPFLAYWEDAGGAGLTMPCTFFICCGRTGNWKTVKMIK